jgi:hypothetical protein
MTDLTGEWRLERRSGLLPPLGPARKRVAGRRGHIALGPLWLPFQVAERAGPIELRYRVLPVVDVLNPCPGGFEGRSLLLGLSFGRFRMRRDGAVEPPSSRAAAPG